MKRGEEREEDGMLSSSLDTENTNSVLGSTHKNKKGKENVTFFKIAGKVSNARRIKKVFG